MDEARIGIIGLGPVGLTLAAHLVEGGAQVVLEDISQKLLDEIRENGLRVVGIRELSVSVREVVGSLEELTDLQPSIIFIATKACFLSNVLSELKTALKPDIKIVSFQNGLGNEQLVSRTLRTEKSYRAIVNYAGNMIEPGKVKMNWFQPPNYVGVFQGDQYGVDESTRYIADLLTACGLATEESDDIKRHVWEKTILNSALCSICALTGQTMKEAMEFGSSRDLAIRVLKEGIAVAKADGYDFGDSALEAFSSYLSKGGAHKPSMLIDVENKRMTEVDFLSGAIASCGRQYGVDTPVNNTLTGLLKSLEHSYQTHD